MKKKIFTVLAAGCIMLIQGCLKEKKESEIIEVEKKVISVYVPQYEFEKDNVENDCYFGSISSVKTNSDIKIIFQNEIDNDSVNEESIALLNNKAKKIKSKIIKSDDCKSIYLKNIEGLKNGKNYFLKLSKSLKTKDGKDIFKTNMIMDITTETSANNQINLPELTGEYGVGTSYLQLKDESRDETLGENNNGKRELSLQVWYPTDKNSEECRASYADYMTREFCANIGILKRGKLESILTNSQMNIPAFSGEKKFPVLIFSHGLGEENIGYQALIEDVVSHGYILFSISHPYFAGITSFYDCQNIINGDFRISNCVFEVGSKEWIEKIHSEAHIVVEDIKFVADKIKELNKEEGYILAGKMDTDNIGIYGHSYGGYGAVAASEIISECKASIDIDGSILNPIKQITKPVYFIRSESGKKYGDNTIEEMWKNISTKGYMAEVKNTMHRDYIDFNYIGIEGVYGTINPMELFTYTNKTIIDYFNLYLKEGDESEFLKSVVDNKNVIFSKK